MPQGERNSGIALCRRHEGKEALLVFEGGFSRPLNIPRQGDAFLWTDERTKTEGRARARRRKLAQPCRFLCQAAMMSNGTP